MSTVISPVTKKNNTTLADTFLAKDIIALYNQQFNIDVSAYFRNAGSFYLYKCNDTGYKFYHPEKMDGDGKFYEALQEKLGEEYYHTWKFENQLALDEIKRGDKVLDIGCGIGNFISRASQKSDEVCGLELNANAAEICRQKGLQVFHETIQTHAKQKNEYYDVVCMFQVLEHIYDVQEFIKASLTVLKKGGKLIIGVPNNEPYFLGYDKFCTLNLPPHHMGLWNKKVFSNFSKLFNLSVIKVQYDNSGFIKAQAYSLAKYLAGIKSIAGKHSLKQKSIIAFFALYTLPVTAIKKLLNKLQGSHIAVVFIKK